MKNKTGFNPLSRTSAHRRAMSRNMVTSLFRYERITTTCAKAKEVRRAAEKLITLIKSCFPAEGLTVLITAVSQRNLFRMRES